MTQSPVEEKQSVEATGVGSFTDYFEAAMRSAHYEILEDEEGFFGTVPGLQGLWGHATTLEECRTDLRSALEDWVLLGLHLGHEIPLVDGIDLNFHPPDDADVRPD